MTTRGSTEKLKIKEWNFETQSNKSSGENNITLQEAPPLSPKNLEALQFKKITNRCLSYKNIYCERGNVHRKIVQKINNQYKKSNNKNLVGIALIVKIKIQNTYTNIEWNENKNRGSTQRENWLNHNN